MASELRFSLRPDRRRILNDSIDSLKADMLASHPDAVKVAAYTGLEEFLDLSIKYARKWKELVEIEPWKAQAVLVDAVAWLKEAHSQADREIAARRKAPTTAKAFVR